MRKILYNKVSNLHKVSDEVGEVGLYFSFEHEDQSSGVLSVLKEANQALYFMYK